MKGRPRPTRGKPGGKGAEKIGRTAIKVFKEKDKQLKKKDKKEKKPMTMTSKNIIKEPEDKGKAEPPPPKGHEHKHHEPEQKKEDKKEADKPKSIFEENFERATSSRDPAHTNPATAGYLSPAQAVAKEVRDTKRAQGGAEPAPVVGARADKPDKPKEDQDDKILRILKGARIRLQGRGMPELDIEVDELIGELEKK